MRKLDNDWARSDQDTTDTFAAHLEYFSLINEIKSDLNPIIKYRNRPAVIHSSPGEVKAAIKKLKTHKAAGLDLVTAKMFKELPQRAALMLTYLFNTILRLQHTLKDWKVVKIILIPKPGKLLGDPKSYRSISLLPTKVSKLFQKLFLKRLCKKQ